LPVYINAGAPAALTQANLRIGIFGSSAIGSANQPVYLAANGAPTAGNTMVNTTDAQSIAGIKTFTSIPQVTANSATRNVLAGVVSGGVLTLNTL
jgi:hypothetical protein